MANLKIQQIFNVSWNSYSRTHTVSNEQFKAATSVYAMIAGTRKFTTIPVAIDAALTVRQ